MLQQIDHVNIVARDLDAMVAFYRDVMGFVVTKEVVIEGEWIEEVVALRGVVARVVFLELGQGPRIELIQYVSPQGLSPDGLSVAHTRGLRHIAFKVADIDQVYATLRERGVEFLGEPQVVSSGQVAFAGGVRKHLVYFHDPEGTLLELCEYRAV